MLNTLAPPSMGNSPPPPKKSLEMPHGHVTPELGGHTPRRRAAGLQLSTGMTWKERTEKQFLLDSLRPPWLGLLSHPWSRNRLGSHCWTGVGSRLPCRVSFTEPFLNLCCLLGSAWDQSPEVNQVLKDPGGSGHQASIFPGAGIPSSNPLTHNVNS